MQQTIKLMADYGCWPLWYSPSYLLDMDAKGVFIPVALADPSVQTVGNIDPKTLPISSRTRKLLRIWQVRFDATLNVDDPMESGFGSEEAAQAFDQEGYRIWQSLVEELDEYRVVYQPVVNHGILLNPKLPDIVFAPGLGAQTARK